MYSSYYYTNQSPKYTFKNISFELCQVLEILPLLDCYGVRIWEWDLINTKDNVSLLVGNKSCYWGKTIGQSWCFQSFGDGN